MSCFGVKIHSPIAIATDWSRRALTIWYGCWPLLKFNSTPFQLIAEKNPWPLCNSYVIACSETQSRRIFPSQPKLSKARGLETRRSRGRGALPSLEGVPGGLGDPLHGRGPRPSGGATPGECAIRGGAHDGGLGARRSRTGCRRQLAWRLRGGYVPRTHI